MQSDTMYIDISQLNGQIMLCITYVLLVTNKCEIHVQLSFPEWWEIQGSTVLINFLKQESPCFSNSVYIQNCRFYLKKDYPEISGWIIDNSRIIFRW